LEALFTRPVVTKPDNAVIEEATTVTVDAAEKHQKVRRNSIGTSSVLYYNRYYKKI
jgi:hypothetical protein